MVLKCNLSSHGNTLMNASLEDLESLQHQCNWAKPSSHGLVKPFDHNTEQPNEEQNMEERLNEETTKHPRLMIGRGFSSLNMDTQR